MHHPPIRKSGGLDESSPYKINQALTEYTKYIKVGLIN